MQAVQDTSAVMDSLGGRSSVLFFHRILPILLATTSTLLTRNNIVSAQLLDPNLPVVTTSYGRIRGSVQDIGDGKSVLSFIGIPFAAPPTRGNRFRVSFSFSLKMSSLQMSLETSHLKTSLEIIYIPCLLSSDMFQIPVRRLYWSWIVFLICLFRNHNYLLDTAGIWMRLTILWTEYHALKYSKDSCSQTWCFLEKMKTAFILMSLFLPWVYIWTNNCMYYVQSLCLLTQDMCLHRVHCMYVLTASKWNAAKVPGRRLLSWRGI